MKTEPTNPAPKVGSSDLVRRPYKCLKCRKTTHLSEWDIWGKVIRCIHCTGILMDNRHTSPPNKEITD